MTDRSTLEALASLLAVALGKNEPANTATVPTDSMGTEEIAQGAGIKKWDDHRLSRPMQDKADPGKDLKPLDKEWFEYDPEGATAAYEAQWKDKAAYRTEVDGHHKPLADGRVAKGERRKKATRARKARKDQFDKIERSAARPKAERLAKAWEVILPMAPIIEGIAKRKEQWAARHLGTIVSGDVPSMVIENMVLMLAKSDEDLDVLAVSAAQLGGEMARTGSLPGHQGEDERKEARRFASGRRWLMSAANNWVMNTLNDLYREGQNVRFESIDKIDTIMANINGVGDDPMVAKHKADRAPAMSGARWREPGQIDRDVLAMVIAAAITERRLDRLVELLIHEDNLRTDGWFRWTELAEAVFLSGPDGSPERWDMICAATAQSPDPRRARADLARKYVGNLFEFLPGLILEAIHAFDYVSTGIAYYNGQIRAHVRSEFDSYLTDRPRTLGQPKLVYATPHEAALAIIENLDPAL